MTLERSLVRLVIVSTAIRILRGMMFTLSQSRTEWQRKLRLADKFKGVLIILVPLKRYQRKHRTLISLILMPIQLLFRIINSAKISKEEGNWGCLVSLRIR
jgi:hypothetical protein